MSVKSKPHYGPARHGTLSGYVHLKCREPCCRIPALRYENDLGNGRKRLVPAGKVRVHLRHLKDAGVGRRSVARASGVSEPTIQSILQHRQETVRGPTARALLGVTVYDADDYTVVSNRVARWIVEGLRGKGWADVTIQRVAGLGNNTVGRLMRRSVRAGTARKLHSLGWKMFPDCPPDPW